MAHRYLGNFSAVGPEHSRAMFCDDCDVSWTGCWDNFMCPECGKGELPTDGSDKFPIDIKKQKSRCN